MSRQSPAMTGAMLAAIWFGVFATAQWLALHWRLSSRRSRLLFLGFGACVVGFALTVCLPGDGSRCVSSALFGALIMSCLFVLYGPVYYVVTHSLSVESMIRLLEGGGRLDRRDLSEVFASRHLVQRRLDTLVSSGYVVRTGQAFRITRRGRRVIAPMLAIQSLWRLGPGG
jgi:hypothetical protein